MWFLRVVDVKKPTPRNGLLHLFQWFLLNYGSSGDWQFDFAYPIAI